MLFKGLKDEQVHAGRTTGKARRTAQINPGRVGNAPQIQRTAEWALMASNSSTVLINKWPW